jgi:phosphate transport system substrate-binding protein
VKSTTLAGAIALALAGAASLFATGADAQTRDRIQITGSSTVFPFTTAVAERFGQRPGARTPIVESTGTGGGMRIFCSGVGVNTPDVTNASRRITQSEFNTCRQNGVEVIELKIGFDGIVLASSKATPEMNVTLEQLYLALAQEVPVGPNNTLVRNPHRNWSDISPSLPNKRIEVIGPPPTSGTRDSFNELGILAGCQAAQRRLGIQIEARRCQAIRDDGVFVEGGENDNIIVQRLVANPNSYGVFGYSFLEENQDKIQGATINGVQDSVENIQSGRYPMARSMYVYFKRNHVGVVPGLQEFIQEYSSDAAMGQDGYLERKGLVPLPAADRQRSAAGARALTVMTGLN